MERPKELDSFAQFPEDTAEGMSRQDACTFARYALELEARIEKALVEWDKRPRYEDAKTLQGFARTLIARGDTMVRFLRGEEA